MKLRFLLFFCVFGIETGETVFFIVKKYLRARKKTGICAKIYLKVLFLHVNYGVIMP
jgi:hypothetical protein